MEKNGKIVKKIKSKDISDFKQAVNEFKFKFNTFQLNVQSTSTLQIHQLLKEYIEIES